MKAILRALLPCLAILPLAACSVDTDSQSTDADASGAVESVNSVESAITDPACFNQCTAGCNCGPGFAGIRCMKGCTRWCLTSCERPIDLWPHLTGQLELVGFNSKRGRHVLTLHNFSSAPVSNVKVLMQTNLPAGLLDLKPAGFGCYLPSGYFPRLGIECVGGSLPANGTIAIELLTSLSVPGANVFSVIVDPDQAIAETDEANNLTNVTLMAP